MASLEQVFLTISPKKFHILKFLLEGYDNLGIISSYQSDRGVVLLRYNKANTQEIFDFLCSVAPEIQATEY
jgi:hypothetical protein